MTSSQANSHLLNTRAQQTQTPAPRVKGLGQADREQALEHAKAAVEVALANKALEPVLLEVGALCSYTEYILLASGRSNRHVDAISQSIAEFLKKRGLSSLGVEGLNSGQWVLGDYGELVVHVFYHPVRGYYRLESLWNEAKEVAIEVPEEARVQDDDYF